MAAILRRIVFTLLAIHRTITQRSDAHLDAEHPPSGRGVMIDHFCGFHGVTMADFGA
ncbi:MAG: hypothetical protein KF718_31210 [Polyangiaceae bacterium]|nr:hypothetical protein [Polyangiaceae bacterium]